MHAQLKELPLVFSVPLAFVGQGMGDRSLRAVHSFILPCKRSVSLLQISGGGGYNFFPKYFSHRDDEPEY